MDVNILIAIAGFITPISLIAGRYFINKEKCFTALQYTVTQLAKHDEKASIDHDGYNERFDGIETRQQKNEIYLKLLLDNAKIHYD